MKKLLILLLAPFFLASAANAQSGITPCGTAKTLAVTTSSSNVQLLTCGQTVLLWNVGATEIFYKYGSASTTTAAVTDWSLPSGGFVVLNLGSAGLYLAAITSSSSSTVRITQGQTR